MNTLKITLLAVLVTALGFSQEKQIDFKRGTVNICTNANIKITGYNGDQVVIKNTNPNAFNFNRNSNVYFNLSTTDSLRVNTRRDSVSYIFFTQGSKERQAKAEGLTPLGKSPEEENAIDARLDINIVNGELLIRDKALESGTNSFIVANDRYEILIPNTVKLIWNNDKCNGKNAQNYMFTSKSCQLSNFSGSTEISSLYLNVSLTDVTGPALVNTIGGDIKVVFNNQEPKDLFSLISNDGDIDITLPETANISMNITGSEVLSNLDFNIISENILQDRKNLKVDLNRGGKTITTQTEYGTVYLRKQ